MKIAYKLTLIFILIALLPSLSIGYLSFKKGKAIISSDVNDHLKSDADQLLGLIDRIIFARQQDIISFSESSILKNEESSSEEIKEELLKVKNKNPEYVSLSFFNMDRIRLVDTEDMNINDQHEMVPYWEDVLLGKISAGRDVRIAEELKIPIIYFAAPVYSELGKPIGVVVARYNLEEINNLLNSFAAEKKEESQAVLITKGKDIISSSDPYYESKILREKISDLAAVRRVVEGEEGTIEELYHPQGKSALVTFVGEKGLYDFIGNGWSLIVISNEKKAFISITDFRNQIIITSVFILFVSILIGFIYGKIIAKPIEKLAGIAQKIAAGDIKQRVEIESKDEIGELAIIFNQMLDNIEKTQGELKEQNSHLEDARKAVINILEDVADSERDLNHKTTELEKFRQAADASFDHIVITDPEGVMLYMNSAAEEITGFSKEESLGKKPGGLWGGQMSREIYEKMWDTIKTKKSPYAGEITNKRKSGEKYLASIRISPILDGKGDVRFYVGVERDITEERETQVQVIRHASKLQTANKAIEKQKESAESILRFLKSIGDGVVATDMDGKVIFFNEAAEKLSGVASEKALGDFAWKTLYYFKENDPKTQIRVIRKFLAGEDKFNRANDRLILKRHDGAAVDVSFSISLIYGKNNEKQGCIMVMRDVTEEREIEKTKDNFLSVAAHQLRTPLSGIRWSLEMLLGDDVGKLPKEAHEVVENINENTMRLITLVNDLLNVSRINMGKVVEPASPVNIVDTIKAVLKSGSGFAAKNKIKIIFDPSKKAEVKTLISQQHLFESIENIVSNAIKYTPKNGKVKISLSQKTGKVRIAIVDSGIGIPKKEQEKLFSKFFRAQNAIQKDPDGSGLGLSVVKSFIEEAGGTVSFESEEGKGTTFFVDLPIYKESK